MRVADFLPITTDRSMNLFRQLLSLSIAAIAAVTATPSDKISVIPTGRLHLDGATYFTSYHSFADGVAIPEARLGAKATYGRWTAKVEIGVAFGQLSLKDIYLQYNVSDKLYVRAGNYIHPFGLQSVYYASFKPTMEQPGCNAAFDLPRSLGIMANYGNRHWLATASIGVEGKAAIMSANQMGKTGWGIDGRGVWRTTTDNIIAQFGWSGAYLTPQYNSDPALNHHTIDIQSNFPTSVSRITAIATTIDDARGYFKFTPELLLAYKNVALESQYYHGTVWRHLSAPTFTGYGAYATVRTLIHGGNYGYDAAEGRIATPGKGAIELAMQYSYTSLVDRRAGNYGGRLSDVSLTANWYINRYIIWRIRGGYSHRWDRGGDPSIDLGSLQTRLQIVF